MKIEYYTIFSNHLDTFDEKVNEKLRDGWELQGGVAVSVIKAPTGDDEYWYTYLQAVVKRL